MSIRYGSQFEDLMQMIQNGQMKQLTWPNVEKVRYLFWHAESILLTQLY